MLLSKRIQVGLTISTAILLFLRSLNKSTVKVFKSKFSSFIFAELKKIKTYRFKYGHISKAYVIVMLL